MLTAHAVLDRERLPSRSVTVRFEFTEHPKIYWLVLDGPPDLVKGFPRWLGPSHFSRYALAS